MVICGGWGCGSWDVALVTGSRQARLEGWLGTEKEMMERQLEVTGQAATIMIGPHMTMALLQGRALGRSFRICWGKTDMCSGARRVPFFQAFEGSVDGGDPRLLPRRPSKKIPAACDKKCE
jgi:hypothetical protein